LLEVSPAVNEKAFKEALGAKAELGLTDLGEGGGGHAMEAVPRSLGRGLVVRDSDRAKKGTEKLGKGRCGAGGLEPLLESLKQGLPLGLGTVRGASRNVEVVLLQAAQRASILGVQAPPFAELADTTHANGVFGDVALFSRLQRLHSSVHDRPVHQSKGLGCEAALPFPVLHQFWKDHGLVD
jgi:hypothetical protein